MLKQDLRNTKHELQKLSKKYDDLNKQFLKTPKRDENSSMPLHLQHYFSQNQREDG